MLCGDYAHAHETSEGRRYFYDGDLEINLQPSAYRQNRNCNERIARHFDGHISEEKPIAQKLQAFLEACSQRIRSSSQFRPDQYRERRQLVRKYLKGLKYIPMLLLFALKASLSGDGRTLKQGSAWVSTRELYRLFVELDKNVSDSH